MRPTVNHVAVVNRSSLQDAEVSICVEVYRSWVKAVADAWGLAVPGLALYGRDHTQAVDDEAAIIIIDSGNEPDAFGWHTALGVAFFGYVDLGMCRRYDEPWSRVFGHELAELVVDPPASEWVGPYADGSHVAKEVCDAVQRFSVPAQGEYMGRKLALELADFVLPAWFQPDAPGPYSYLNVAPAPLACAAGGYFLREENGLVTSEGAVRVKNYGRTLARLVGGRPPPAAAPAPVT